MCAPKGRFVLVLVLESDGTAIRRVCSQHLEGSRFGSAPRRPLEFRLNANPEETCKSRRLLGTSQQFRSSMAGCKRIRAKGKCIALGNSREPPAETFLGRVDVEAKFASWPRTRQSSSPPGGGSKHVLLTYHPPFDDEDENEAPGEHPQPATREQFREGASNWVDTPFLQATTFEHEHERQTPNAF